MRLKTLVLILLIFVLLFLSFSVVQITPSGPQGRRPQQTSSPFSPPLSSPNLNLNVPDLFSSPPQEITAFAEQILDLIEASYAQDTPVWSKERPNPDLACNAASIETSLLSSSVPDFFVIGVAKGGTTSFCNYIGKCSSDLHRFARSKLRDLIDDHHKSGSSKNGDHESEGTKLLQLALFSF